MELESATPSYTSEKRRSETDILPTPLTQRIVWPVYVILGQTLLLSLAWGFFVAVRARGQIPLKQQPANFFQLFPQAKTFVATVLGTTLSTFSSYLFSQAIRHAIVVSLTRPVSLSTLGSGILLSRRALITDRKVKWIFISGVFVVATLAQTACWSSLLTPTNIAIEVPLAGREIDVSSASFNDAFPELWATGLQDYLDSEILSIIDESGAVSATAQAGYPAVIDFDAIAHFASTRGIFPVLPGFDSFGIDINTTSQFLTSNTKEFPPITSPPFNLSMEQQGVSAGVSCAFMNLDETTNPTLSRFADPAEVTLADGVRSFTAWEVTTNCPGIANSSGIQLSTNNDTLFALSCPTVDDLGASAYTVIIDGQGFYSGFGTIVCTVQPQIRNMTSTYSGFGFSFVETDFNDTFAIDAGQIGYAGIYALTSAFSYGQGEIRNNIGDSILAVFDNQGEDSSNALLGLLQAYIIGILEFTATAVKTDLSLLSRTAVPQNMTRPIAGNAIISTFGWEYSITSGLVLIPITFVGLASILIILIAQFHNRGIATSHADFDPNNPLRLMAAASAGGMTHIFHGVDEEDVNGGLTKKIRLGRVGGRDGFFEEAV